jgi:hypothetical protein
VQKGLILSDFLEATLGMAEREAFLQPVDQAKSRCEIAHPDAPGGQLFSLEGRSNDGNLGRRGALVGAPPSKTDRAKELGNSAVYCSTAIIASCLNFHSASHFNNADGVLIATFD